MTRENEYDSASQPKIWTAFWEPALLPSSKNPPLWTITRTTLNQATINSYEVLKGNELLQNKLITTDENDVVCNKQEKW